ncbi:MAG: Nudix family hydrolase [Gammaproteobacteria bacterium]|nr:Nudix family hydrolase [Gammaproteobacteria bacterium]
MSDINLAVSNIAHVAVCVIKDRHGHFLIARRHADSHQGGLWEFPGGKIEKGESVLQALKRELDEETGLQLISASPLIRIHHDYGDKLVLLDVWNIDEYSGFASGKEGQEIRWIKLNEFELYQFPVANIPIIMAINLPDKYMITGEFKDEKDLLLRVQNALDKGINLIQFRAHGLDIDLYLDYAKKIYNLCQVKKSKLILNMSVENYKKYCANAFSDGIHLTSHELELCSVNTIDIPGLVSASLHNVDDLLRAHQCDISFAVLSPVKKTLSHPERQPIGWENFYEITEQAKLPIYALGGMCYGDITPAKNNGAQGVAAIGTFWNA